MEENVVVKFWIFPKDESQLRTTTQMTVIQPDQSGMDLESEKVSIPLSSEAQETTATATATELPDATAITVDPILQSEPLPQLQDAPQEELTLEQLRERVFQQRGTRTVLPPGWENEDVDEDEAIHLEGEGEQLEAQKMEVEQPSAGESTLAVKDMDTKVAMEQPDSFASKEGEQAVESNGTVQEELPTSATAPSALPSATITAKTSSVTQPPEVVTAGAAEKGDLEQFR